MVDKRGKTSAENGKKGGRPAGNSIQINIKRQYVEAALKKDDLGEAIEQAFRDRFGKKVSVRVQTQRRLEKAGINYDPYSGMANLIILNDQPFKFPWELRYFTTEFISLTKGKEAFTFNMLLPRSIAEKAKS